MNMPVIKGCSSHIRVNMTLPYGNCRSRVYTEAVSVPISKCCCSSYIMNVSGILGLQKIFLRKSVYDCHLWLWDLQIHEYEYHTLYNHLYNKLIAYSILCPIICFVTVDYVLIVIFKKPLAFYF